MAYTEYNFKTKKALRDAIRLRDIPVYQPGPFGPSVKDGTVFLEGPHSPEPHKWYATATARGGVIRKGSKID